MLTWLSKNIFHPLWDVKDHSIRLNDLKELEKTQWESEEELRIRQWGKFKNILQYAYENCKYYKSVFDKHQITPTGINLPQDLSKIPVLTKKQIQDNTDNLVSRLHHKEKLISAKTGGSTGKSLKIYFDKLSLVIYHFYKISKENNVDTQYDQRIAGLLSDLHLDLRHNIQPPPRPFIVEFDGMPSSGKTTIIRALDKYFRHNGWCVLPPQEGAQTIRHIPRHVALGQYNIRTALYSIQKIMDESHILIPTIFYCLIGVFLTLPVGWNTCISTTCLLTAKKTY